MSSTVAFLVSLEQHQGGDGAAQSGHREQVAAIRPGLSERDANLPAPELCATWLA